MLKDEHSSLIRWRDRVLEKPGPYFEIKRCRCSTCNVFVDFSSTNNSIDHIAIKAVKEYSSHLCTFVMLLDSGYFQNCTRNLIYEMQKC